MSNLSLEKTRDSQLHNGKYSETHSVTFGSVSFDAFAYYTFIPMQRSIQEEHGSNKYQ